MVKWSEDEKGATPVVVISLNAGYLKSHGGVGGQNEKNEKKKKRQPRLFNQFLWIEAEFLRQNFKYRCCWILAYETIFKEDTSDDGKS